MGNSLEILVLLIYALLPRFEHKTPHTLHAAFSAGKLMHYSCNGSINLPASSTPSISPPASCQDGDSSEDPAWSCALSVCAAHACLSTASSSSRNHRLNRHLSPVPPEHTFRV